MFTKERTTDKLYNYFRSKEFVCENTPLWKVVAVLSEAYNMPITIEREELRSALPTTTFDNESLDKILEVIGQTFGATIVKKDTQVIIK